MYGKEKGVSTLVYSGSTLAPFWRSSYLVQSWFGSVKSFQAKPWHVRQPPEGKDFQPGVLQKPPTNTPQLSFCRAHEALIAII